METNMHYLTEDQHKTINQFMSSLMAINDADYTAGKCLEIMVQLGPNQVLNSISTTLITTVAETLSGPDGDDQVYMELLKQLGTDPNVINGCLMTFYRCLMETIILKLSPKDIALIKEHLETASSAKAN